MNLFGLWRLNCSVCVSWTRSSALSRDSRGKYISPAPPHFLLCAGLSFPAGCALTARGGQLFTARFAGCGRGPSLRCVHLRRTCSSLPASAAAEPCSPFTSAARRIPRFFAGRQCCFVSHTRYYAQLQLCSDIFAGNSISVNFLPMSFSFQLWLWWRHNLCSRIRSNGGRASPHPRSSASRAAASRAASCRGMAR